MDTGSDHIQAGYAAAADELPAAKALTAQRLGPHVSLCGLD